MELMDSIQRETPEGGVVIATALSSPSSAPSTPQRRHRSLFDLDMDIFHYLCSFIPVKDLLFHLTAVNREARRRTWANHELWQQLWMRYLVQFFKSLIPPPKLSSSAASSSAGGTGTTASSPSSFPRVSFWSAGGVGDTSTTTVEGVSPHSDAAWCLYHYHVSKEARPRVELLERLSLASEKIADPPVVETPKKNVLPFSFGSASRRGAVQNGGKAQEQTLRFAQACATQLVASNLTHTESPPPASALLSAQGSAEASSTAAPAATSPPSSLVVVSKKERIAATLMKRREGQAERLRRALFFLLSADCHRQAFQDRLWSTTYEAGEAYRQEALKGAVDLPERRRHRKNRKAKALVSKDRLRPLSWLDDRDTSVKVLFFDDDTRSVGDAVSVQAERIKLIAAVAHHWRLAYAHQFYLTPVDGKDHGSAHLHSSTLRRARVNRGRDGNDATLADSAQDVQYTQHDRRVLWEQVYRRFRDSSANNVQSARTRESLRRGVVGEENEGSMSASAADAAADGASAVSSSARTPVIPSSGNPLFDMHLLTYTKRKQFYAAMLASTVEVPDGMGAFFATCVSEPFLRWWCWRSRRLRDIAAVEPATTNHRSRVLPSIAVTFPAAPSTHGAGPTTLWTARVCSVHKPQYGTTASDGSFGRRAPIEAEESIVYSSSYSDVTSTDTLASDSSSIDFVEEEEVDESVVDGDATLGFVETEGEGNVGSSNNNQRPGMPQRPSNLSRAGPPHVALLFPLPHMLAYWFMMHHVTFYNYQVYRRRWGDQEITIAVCSRILSPTGHSVECRLFYTLRCVAFPRMYTKMMFTPSTLPALTLQDKMSARSPYRSPSMTSVGSFSSSSTTEHPSPGGSSSTTLSESESELLREKHATLDEKPVDSRQIYDLFWIGFGRVEVESGPTISRSNLVRLRVALGLPVDFPMGLLWNVLMFASGVGPLILKDHRHSLYLSYSKSFIDVLEDEFGEVSCYGYGARPTPLSEAGRTMPNPLDAAAERMRAEHNLGEAARALAQEIAEARNASSTNNMNSNNTQNNDDDVDVSFSTVEPEGEAREEEIGDEMPSSGSATSFFATSPSTYGSWGLDSEFSSMGGRSSWRDFNTPFSDTL